MVAAVCITGIFIYFFLWSRKLIKNQRQEWEKFGQEEEVISITGIITHSFTQKKRLHSQHWFIEIEATLYNEKENRSYKILWRKPFTKDLDIPEVEKGQVVIAKGNHRQGIFYVNKLKKAKKLASNV
jgi:hypothetical protein